MEQKLKMLAEWLSEVEKSDFGYDSYSDGKLEDAIAQSQVEVCNKIGSYLEEILETDELVNSTTKDIPGFENVLDDLDNLTIKVNQK